MRSRVESSLSLREQFLLSLWQDEFVQHNYAVYHQRMLELSARYFTQERPKTKAKSGVNIRDRISPKAGEDLQVDNSVTQSHEQRIRRIPNHARHLRQRGNIFSSK